MESVDCRLVTIYGVVCEFIVICGVICGLIVICVWEIYCCMCLNIVVV